MRKLDMIDYQNGNWCIFLSGKMNLHFQKRFVPLNCVNWAQVPETEKDAYWGFVLDKYIIPQEGRDWVMRTIYDLWRLHKSHTKSRYYLSKDNDEDRIANNPYKIPLEEFKALLEY
ncbi:hypothetical protein OROMI_021809 [Orobanche minor]